jgi:putative flavoprotein involved in K+ transport
MEHLDVIIVGAGQAGLALSHELSASEVEHVVLERGRVGETWRHRWDTFCLVTPNWTVQLPGHPYSGPDPDGFMLRDEIVAVLEGYAGSFGAPVRQGVSVTAVESIPNGGFIVHSTAGDRRSRLRESQCPHWAVARSSSAAHVPTPLLLGSLQKPLK